MPKRGFIDSKINYSCNPLFKRLTSQFFKNMTVSFAIMGVRKTGKHQN
jgi:hypothetical protein